MAQQPLIGFYKLVSLGSFTKAAEATFRSQSALSQQVKKLEDDLGCKLLDRIGRQGFQLTTAGEALYRYASNLIHSEDQFNQELAEIKGENTGVLRLTAATGILFFLLAGPLSRYKALYPKVRIELFDCAPQTSVELVAAGNMDFCVTHKSAIPESLETFSWKQGEYAFMTPHDHPLTKLKKISLEDIVKYPLILPKKDVKRTARKNFDILTDKKGISYQVAFQTSNIFLAGEYVRRGFGVGFFLSFEGYRKMSAQDLAFTFLENLFPPETISIGVRKDYKLFSRKQEFIDFLLSQ